MAEIHTTPSFSESDFSPYEKKVMQEIIRFCNKYAEFCQDNPQQGYAKACELKFKADGIIKAMGKKYPDDILLKFFEDYVADSLTRCIIYFCNATENWNVAGRFLVDNARPLAISAATKDRVERNIKILYSNAAVEAEEFSPPIMWTINGVGTRLYGFGNVSGEPYNATLFFCILFIPIIPLARYQVSSEDGRTYRFYKKMPYGKFNIIYLIVVIIGIVVLATH